MNFQMQVLDMYKGKHCNIEIQPNQRNRLLKGSVSYPVRYFCEYCHRTAIMMEPPSFLKEFENSQQCTLISANQAFYLCGEAYI